MNIMHMKYALEVARCGSINRAAEQLYIAQPNLSRYIRELEEDLGIALFERSFRGMTVTPEGEVFIHYARQVLGQIDDIERMFKEGGARKRKFSISVPRASYVADAFVQFSKSIDEEPAEILYMETNTQKAIRNLLNADYNLGIIRYALEDDEYFRHMLSERGIACELVTDFTYVLVMSRESEIVRKETIYYSDLAPMIEICHGDPFVPTLPSGAMHRREQPEEPRRTILLFERGGQFDLLCENSQTYMWVSPIPEKLLERYNLVQRHCQDNRRVYRDALIYRKDYRLSPLDQQFLRELEASRQATIG